MEMSETTTEIFAAFAKFQGELTNAVKSKSGHGYKYADLFSVLRQQEIRFLITV